MVALTLQSGDSAVFETSSYFENVKSIKKGYPYLFGGLCQTVLSVMDIQCSVQKSHSFSFIIKPASQGPMYDHGCEPVH